MRIGRLKSIFTTILAIAVFVTMCAPSFMLISAKKADAKTVKSINIGTDNILAPASSDGSWTTSDYYLYYGRHGGENKTATKYRVLAKNNGIMLMDNDRVVGYSPYNDATDSNRNQYKDSFLRNEIYDGKQFFTDIELNSIASTALEARSAYEENGFSFFDDSSSDNKIFLLSVYDVTKYYKNGTGSKEGWPTWWTRSGDSSNEDNIGVVSTNGAVIEGTYGVTGGVSPAANLNLNSKDILFSSDMAFSKTGALSKVNTSDTHTWKLTLKDSSKKVTAKKGTIGTNKKVTVPVTLSGSDIDQVSVVITNGDISSSNTEILYYGKMDDIDTTSTSEQKGTFTLPTDFNVKTNKVYLLAEDINDDASDGAGSVTDYTSEPLEISFGYLIEFDTKGATSGTASSQIVTEGDKAIEPTGILKTGYILKGWFENSDFSGDAYNFATAVTKAMTLYAKWLAEYKLTYDLNGGKEPNPPNPTSYTVEDKTITLREPTKDNLSFAGWTSETEGITTPQKQVTITTGNTGAKDYKANWNATITFDTKGGSKIADKVVAENTVVKEGDIATPTKANLHFAGWYDDEKYATKHDFTKPLTKNTKLYAKWEAKVTFNTNGGSAVGTKTVTEGETVAMPSPAPTKANLHFAGWYKDQACTDGQEFNFKTETITGDKTLYVKWTAEVTFTANGGTPIPSKQTIKEGDKAKEPTEAIAKAGYIFKGWYDSATYSGNPYSFATAVVGDFVLYAKWQTVDYAITIDLNGGKEPTPSNPTSYTIEDKTITLQEPTKDDLSFAGWTSESDGITTPQKEVTITTGNTGAKDYKANWNATITFDTNGGSKIPDKVVAENTIIDEKDLTEPEKENLHFAGWYDDEKFTTKHDFTKPVTQNTKLYAKWEAKVTFDTNGGSDVDVKTVAEGEKVTAPDTEPTKENLYFAGWYKDQACTDGQEFDFETETITGDKTLYAKWEAKVTFDSNGGSAVEEEIVKEGGKATKPIDPTKRGYTFNAWYLKKVTEEEKTTNQEQEETNPLLYAINPIRLLSNNSNLLTDLDADATGDTDKDTNLDPDVDGKTDTDGDTEKEATEEPYDFDTIVTSSITLLAYWDVIDYDITYKGLTNAKIAENPVTYNVESDEITLNNPTKDGYTFIGWTGDGVTKPTKNMTIAKGSVGDKIFTANWAVRTSDEANIGLLITLVLSSLATGFGLFAIARVRNSAK